MYTYLGPQFMGWWCIFTISQKTNPSLYFGTQVAVFNSPKRTKASSRTFRSTCTDAGVTRLWWSEHRGTNNDSCHWKHRKTWNTWFFKQPCAIQMRFQHVSTNQLWGWQPKTCICGLSNIDWELGFAKNGCRSLVSSKQAVATTLPLRIQRIQETI